MPAPKIPSLKTAVLNADKSVTITFDDGSVATVTTAGDIINANNKYTKAFVSPTTTPTTGNDYIVTGTMSDTINGGAGNDYINANGGSDTLNGGAGSDVILGGAGSDSLTYRISENTSTIDFYNGGAGTDILIIDLTGIAIPPPYPTYQAYKNAMSSLFTTNGGNVDFRSLVNGKLNLVATGFENIQFVGGNDAPVASNDTGSGNEDNSITGNVLTNDTDANSNTLTATLVQGPAHGTVDLNANGSFTYTPAANYFGPDSFTYRVNDGQSTNNLSNIATVNLTIAAVNDAPVAVADSFNGTEDIALTMNVLVNDSDVDNTLAQLTPSMVTGPTKGTLVLNANKTFTYTPFANTNGADSFTYKVSDGSLNSSTVTVTLNIAAVNDAPVANNDTASVNANNSVSIAVLANDTDVDGDTLSILSIGTPLHGTAVIDPNNSSKILYTPASGYFGADSFTYTAKDPSGATSTATVAITVNNPNQPPTAITLINPATPFTDDGNPDTTYSMQINENSDNSFPIFLASINVVDDGQGTNNVTFADAQFFPNGPFSPYFEMVPNSPAPFNIYLRDASFNVHLDYETKQFYDVIIRVDDPAVGGNPDAIITFRLYVVDVNEAPTAVALQDAITEIFENATTHELATISITDDAIGTNTITLTGADAVYFEVSGNKLLLKPSTKLDFETKSSYAVTVNVHDNSVPGSPTLSTNYNLTVKDANDAPIANADNYSTNEDTPLSVAASGVLGNDSDVDSSSLTASLVSGPSHGSLALNPNGSFSYNPAANYNGTDSFTYKVSDGSLFSDIATVNLTIIAVNDGPVAVADSFNGTEDNNLILNVLGNDSDVDSAQLTPSAQTAPSKGSLVLNANKTYTYTPFANANGTDSFTYKVSDGLLFSNTVTVTINLTAVNDAPTDIILSGSTVSENIAGAVFGNLSLVDPDFGDFASHYDVRSDLVEVKNIGGVDKLKLKDGISLNYEPGGQFGFSVLVTGYDQGGLAFHQFFIIKASDQPEAPTDILLLNTTEGNGVTENLAGQVIGDLSIVDEDFGDSASQYEILSDSRFEVKNIGGVEKLKLKDGVSLNYEEAPQGIDLTIKAYDQTGQSIVKTFHITVFDHPEAPTDITLSGNTVAENVAGGMIGNLTLIDPDLGDFAALYVIPFDNRFEVVKVGNVDQLKLKAGVSLNFEEFPQGIDLLIVAYDQTGVREGLPPDSGISFLKTFHITITDVIDNFAPTDILLLNTTEGNSVTENLAGQVIGDLSIVDPDFGDSALHYTLNDSRFEVVNIGGVDKLKLKAGVSLNYETTPSVSLQVTAYDQGGLSFSKFFTINVLDHIEAPTDILLSNTVEGNGVTENIAGAVIGDLSIVDEDFGDSASLYIFPHDNRFEWVKVGGVDKLKLKDGVSLNYEEIQGIDLLIGAYDQTGVQNGFPPDSGLFALKTFHISVIDANESPADIILSNNTVAEATPGKVIGNLLLVDPDIGDSASHFEVVNDARFEVVQNGPDFQLKLKNGVSLDYENVHIINLTIRGYDQDGLFTLQTFPINVTPVNDNAPVLTLTPLPITVNENVTGPFKIAQVSVTDADLDSLTFSATTGFFVQDGFLWANGPFNYEATPFIIASVVVSDGVHAPIKSMMLNINNGTNEITLTPIVNAGVYENTTLAQNKPVATIGFTDPFIAFFGTDALQLSGADAALFDIVGNQLFLKQGTIIPDLSIKTGFDVTVSVIDSNDDGDVRNYHLPIYNTPATATSNSYTFARPLAYNSGVSYKMGLEDLSIPIIFQDVNGDGVLDVNAKQLPPNIPITNGPQSSTSADVFDNDVNYDPSAVKIINISQPFSNGVDVGTVSLTSASSFFGPDSYLLFTPDNSNFTGSVSFTYTLLNLDGSTSTAAVNMNISPRPEGTADSFTITNPSPGQTQFPLNVFANDSFFSLVINPGQAAAVSQVTDTFGTVIGDVIQQNSGGANQLVLRLNAAHANFSGAAFFQYIPKSSGAVYGNITPVTVFIDRASAVPDNTIAPPTINLGNLSFTSNNLNLGGFGITDADNLPLTIRTIPIFGENNVIATSANGQNLIYLPSATPLAGIHL